VPSPPRLKPSVKATAAAPGGVQRKLPKESELRIMYAVNSPRKAPPRATTTPIRARTVSPRVRLFCINELIEVVSHLAMVMPQMMANNATRRASVRWPKAAPAPMATAMMIGMAKIVPRLVSSLRKSRAKSFRKETG
jgi:hypothetical protein